MRFINLLAVFTIFLVYFRCSNSARILGVFPLAGKSINILYNRLMKGLADAGHDVTVISAYKNKLPIANGNYTDVVLNGFAEEYEGLLNRGHFLDVSEEYPIWEVTEYLNLFMDIWNKSLNHPNVQQLRNSSHEFDVVIAEYFWNDCLSIFAHLYKCPLVEFTSMGGVNPWMNDQVGNILLPSYVPHFFMLGDYAQGISFFQRLHNLAFYYFDFFFKHFILFPRNNEVLRGTFDNPPDVSTLYNNISFVLLGSHSSLRQAVPLAPNMAEIGGFHIDPPKKLPKDLKKILDDAKNGAIFFSMGSHIKSKDFSDEKKRMFMKAFARLNQTILWKFEDDNLPGKPDNVFIRKWLPQMDLLAHPNIRLFITHGGHGSLLETIYHGVPVLTIPVFADQFNNAFQAVQLGYALKLSYNDKNFNENTLYALVQEMLYNPQYRENAQRRSKLFHDRPMKPLDTAVYWVEYVIRNKGAPHLGLASRNLPFYTLYNLDIYLFVIVSIFAFYRTVLYVFKNLTSANKSKTKLKKH